MSEIRVTSVVGENGGDRVGLTTGLTVGPLTGTTGIGATISHHGHAQFAGVCTATSLVGNVKTDRIIPTGGVPSGGGGGIIQVVSTNVDSTSSTTLTTRYSYYPITALDTTITTVGANSKILITADQPEIFKVSPGEKIAGLNATNSAVLYVTEMSA